MPQGRPASCYATAPCHPCIPCAYLAIHASLLKCDASHLFHGCGHAHHSVSLWPNVISLMCMIPVPFLRMSKLTSLSNHGPARSHYMYVIYLGVFAMTAPPKIPMLRTYPLALPSKQTFSCCSSYSSVLCLLLSSMPPHSSNVMPGHVDWPVQFATPMCDALLFSHRWMQPACSSAAALTWNDYCHAC